MMQQSKLSTAKANITALLLAIGLYVAGVLLIQFGAHDKPISLFSNLQNITTAIISISVIYCILLILFFVKPIANMPARAYFALNRVNFKSLLFWIAVIVIFEIIGTLLYHQFDLSVYSWWVPVLPSKIPHYLFWLLAILLIAPLLEELLFRGALFTGIAKSKLGIGIAVLITSYLWTIPLADGNLYKTILLFILGLLFGLARAQTKSVVTPIIMHFCRNLFDVILLITALTH